MTHNTHAARRAPAAPPDLAEPPPRPGGRRRRRLLAVVIAVASMVAVVGQPTPAAAEVVDTDNVLIDTANADFGSGLHFFGAPAEPGTVSWHDAVTDDDPWVQVTGTLYLDEPFLGGCAFVWVRFVTFQFERVAGTAETLCRSGPSAGPSSLHVGVASDDVRIRTAEICVQFSNVFGELSDRTCRTAARPRPPVTWPPRPVWP